MKQRALNCQMAKEIKSRELVQKALQKKSLELEAQASSLQEANIALKVLLKEYMDERRVLEEKVVSNLNELIRPNLTRLGTGNLSKRQRALFDAVSSNLDNIISPMSRRFILEGRQLTTAQTQVPI